MYIGIHIKYPLFLSDFNEIWTFGQIFWKYSNIKFLEISAGRGRTIPRGRTDGGADMTKLIAVFRNFANAPKEDSRNTEKFSENICGIRLQVLSNPVVV
jgi:hypothetical protein